MELKLEKALHRLKILGLNLLAIQKVGLLSVDLQKKLTENQIDFAPEDSIILFAHGGKEMWRNLPHPINEADDPIDSFSIEAMKEFAQFALDGDCEILFPLTKHVLPLQKLARELNLSRPSPLGLDISLEYGVWFAFRGALITKKEISSFVPDPFESACLGCQTRECLAACPASAVKLDSSFDIKACADYRFSEKSSCSDRCLSRLSCPYQSEHRYDLAQTQYHMGRSTHLKSLAAHVKSIS